MAPNENVPLLCLPTEILTMIMKAIVPYEDWYWCHVATPPQELVQAFEGWKNTCRNMRLVCKAFEMADVPTRLLFDTLRWYPHQKCTDNLEAISSSRLAPIVRRIVFTILLFDFDEPTREGYQRLETNASNWYRLAAQLRPDMPQSRWDYVYDRLHGLILPGDSATDSLAAHEMIRQRGFVQDGPMVPDLTFYLRRLENMKSVEFVGLSPTDRNSSAWPLDLLAPHEHTQVERLSPKSIRSHQTYAAHQSHFKEIPFIRKIWAMLGAARFQPRELSIGEKVTDWTYEGQDWVQDVDLTQLRKLALRGEPAFNSHKALIPPYLAICSELEGLPALEELQLSGCAWPALKDCSAVRQAGLQLRRLYLSTIVVEPGELSRLLSALSHLKLLWLEDIELELAHTSDTVWRPTFALLRQRPNLKLEVRRLMIDYAKNEDDDGDDDNGAEIRDVQYACLYQSDEDTQAVLAYVHGEAEWCKALKQKFGPRD